MKFTKEDKLWVDIGEAALRLKILPNTVAQWHFRGYVPPSRHYELTEAAKKIGVKLTHDSLHKQWRACKRLKNKFI